MKPAPTGSTVDRPSAVPSAPPAAPVAPTDVPLASSADIPTTTGPRWHTRVKRYFWPERSVWSFRTLYRAENLQLDPNRPPHGSPEEFDVTHGVSGEPAVTFTPYEHFGLALSGGGIRSATFNLGLLQVLARMGILQKLDYLATVSGGGYVGGFLTAWLIRRAKADAEKAQAANGGQNVGAPRPDPFAALQGCADAQHTDECAEVRHLREFSRFLLPRMGLFHTEFWSIAASVIGGLLPSLLAAISLLGVMWYAWYFAFTGVTGPAGDAPFYAAGAILVLLLAGEAWWNHVERANGGGPLNETAWKSHRREIAMYGVASVLTAAGLLVALRAVAPDAATGAAKTAPEWRIPAALGLCTLALFFVRVAVSRFFRSTLGVPLREGFERCLTRLLGITVGVSVLAGLWAVSGWLLEAKQSWALPVTAGGAAAAGGVFAAVKRWLTQPVVETGATQARVFLVNRLKRATPKALATLTTVLLFVLVGVAVHYGISRWAWWQGPAACLGVLALVVFLFDPSRIGLHDFYRSRISRCYLGASKVAFEDGDGEIRTAERRAGLNRHLAESANDDLTLKDLRSVSRPIHLVCVAANDLSGDPLGKLYRGARSAVLSGHGVSLGDETAPLDELRFSSALTASAAAFNSMMGRVSMDLGPSVAFLMSAFNLRLGLWVPHPQNRYRGRYAAPGRFFLMELLGRSRTTASNLHLSDGAHFENFGLYELVRRHCRYILVSDCGADADVAFDDLANVLRRVREDFGVEIEIDVSPLQPDRNGRVRQHAVIGTIHYDGPDGCDKGSILYFKPGLTGDEPPDVLQYSTRNRSFPHQSTGDQFYDEPQWESYRRLGQHAATSALGYYKPPAAGHGESVEWLFREARRRWQAAPDNVENFLGLTTRCTQLMDDLMRDGPERLRIEFFAEASALKSYLAQQPIDAPTELQLVGFLLRVAQTMEDIWVAAQLDRYWSHPSNEGLMNWISRWVGTRSFRRWWPVIGPMYGIGLRDFMKERFKLTPSLHDPNSPADDGAPADEARLTFLPHPEPKRFFETSFVGRHYTARYGVPDTQGRRVFALYLQLRDSDGVHPMQDLAIGFVLTRDEGNHVAWASDKLYICEPLHGGSFRTRLLEAAIAYFQLHDIRRHAGVRVDFGAAPEANRTKDCRREGTALAEAERDQWVNEIAFYKSRGFRHMKPDSNVGVPIRLQLTFRSAEDVPSNANLQPPLAAPAAENV